MNKPTTIDVLIAGQGAAAFSAGLYSVRYQMKTVVVGEQFGGETAIGGLIENYPGQPDIDGFDLMMKFKEQVENLETEIVSSDLKFVKNNITINNNIVFKKIELIPCIKKLLIKYSHLSITIIKNI